MKSESIDPYREYPWRLLGYSNAMLRPVRDLVPKTVYQASLGAMHLYFMANSYDYALKIDSKSFSRSAFDCYSWHCITSWVGPALVIDNIRRVSARFTSSKSMPVLAAYGGFFLCAPLLDRAANWYFYGFWSAGTKSRPSLRL